MLLRQLILFTISGIAATAVYFGAAVVLERRFNLFWTIFGAFWISLPVSYFAQRWFVFDASTTHFEAIPRFIFIQLIGLGVNLWVAKRLEARFASADPWVRRGIIMSAYLIAALATYFAAKYWAFAEPPLPARGRP